MNLKKTFFAQDSKTQILVVGLIITLIFGFSMALIQQYGHIDYVQNSKFVKVESAELELALDSGIHYLDFDTEGLLEFQVDRGDDAADISGTITYVELSNHTDIIQVIEFDIKIGTSDNLYFEFDVPQESFTIIYFTGSKPVSGVVFTDDQISQLDTAKMLRGLYQFSIFTSIILGILLWRHRRHLSREKQTVSQISRLDQEFNVQNVINEIISRYDKSKQNFSNGGWPIRLKDAEFIIKGENVSYYEMRTQRIKGTSSSERLWTVIDRGTFIFTNQRLVFQGNDKAREYRYDQLVRIEVYTERDRKRRIITEGLIFTVSNFAKNHLYDLHAPRYWQELMRNLEEIANGVIKSLKSISTSNMSEHIQCQICDAKLRNDTRFCINCGSSTQHPVGTPSSSKSYNLQDLDRTQFIDLIVKLMKKMGFSNVMVSSEIGFDIQMEEDGMLSKSRIGILCLNNLSVDFSVIEKFQMDLNQLGFTKGYIISNWEFTEVISEYAKQVGIILINRQKLEELLLSYP